ncbi:cysteine desulfurase family protein [Rosistilla ulvae]|uniref:cysteine desulfurase family protein n=1 Tax=Rosistilla ulvae TaxID=1930277 RepID=UPI00119FBC3A|nr:cysteine desulfurase family protein [Rosistilla ulvae]
MTAKPIYLDNNATTRTDPVVVAKMLPYLTEHFGNASSVTHEYGLVAGAAVSEAREAVANLLGCDEKAIVFTSGATEANNLALFGVMRAAANGKHLIVSAAEHKTILDPAHRLEREGYDITVLPVDEYGMVSPSTVRAAIRKDTALVSVMHANNEVGSINSICKIGETCRRAGVLFHTDATQTVGTVRFDLSRMPVDLLSLSAHKMYGPKGIGALYVRRGTPRIRVEPLFEGGGHERRMRSGTLPVHQIVGLGEACRLCKANREVESKRLAEIRDQLRHGLAASVVDIQFNGHQTERMPGSLHVSIPGVNSNALMLNLRNDLAVSSGSACTTLAPEPSHVLIAMGIEPSLIPSSLRFGIGRFNTMEEIERVITLVSVAAKKLRKLSVR